MKATLKNIQIGSNVQMGKITMLVTNETKKDFRGFHVYKGRARDILISKSNFSNPHYMESYKLV